MKTKITPKKIQPFRKTFVTIRLFISELGSIDTSTAVLESGQICSHRMRDSFIVETQHIYLFDKRPPVGDSLDSANVLSRKGLWFCASDTLLCVSVSVSVSVCILENLTVKCNLNSIISF